MKTKRNSNIELLRIFAMLMIICYHIFCHCINVQLTDADSIARMGNGLFCDPHFYKKLLILSVISPLGKSGNIIFVLISGFFMTQKNIDLKKTSVKLLTWQLFAAVALTVGSTVVWRVFKGHYVNLVGIRIFNNMSWFIGYYFIIIVFARLFLNKFLNGLDKKGYLTFILVLFALSQFAWSVATINHFADGLNTLLIGVFAYSLGGYIKLYNPFEKIKTVYIFIVILLVFGLVILSSYNQTNLDIQNFLSSSKKAPFIQRIPSYNDTSVVCVVLGVSLFELFKRFNIGSNKILNFVASSTLMVYLLHDNDLVRKAWQSKDWITLLYYKPFMFIGELILWVLGTFLAGFIGYLVFLIIEKLFRLMFLKKEN